MYKNSIAGQNTNFVDFLDYDRRNGVWNIVDDFHVNPVRLFIEYADTYLDQLQLSAY